MASFLELVNTAPEWLFSPGHDQALSTVIHPRSGLGSHLLNGFLEQEERDVWIIGWTV